MQWGWFPVILVAACGDGGNLVRDAAPADAEPPTTISATDANGNAIEMLSVPDTLVGQSATAQLRITNTGTASSGLIAISIAGAAANDFVLDNALTTCAGQSLDAGDSCEVALAFRPMAVGERVAALTVASAGGATVMVALKGNGLQPDLAFNPPSLDFGTVEIGTAGGQTTIELTNAGTSSVPIGDISVSGAAFTRGASSCGATLAAGASCDVVIVARPQALGMQTGGITVTSGNESFTAPLAVVGARRITIVRNGTGSGTVTSAPAGLDCGSTCTALFEGAVTLTAVPGASTQLTGWSVAGCGQSTTCAVPAETTPLTVTVSFTLMGSSTVDIVFGGNGTGEVRVEGPAGTLASCFATCSVPTQPGDNLTIRASTFSVFGGFSGACTSASANCYLGAVPVGTSTVNVTFTKDPKEQWTRLLPATTVHAVAYDASGNLIVATNTNLFKLSSTGATTWSRPLAVLGVATGPADTIYVVTGTDVMKLDAGGNDVWSRSHALGGCALGEGFQHNVAVGSDGAVAIRGAAGIGRWDTDGTPSWTKSMTAFDRCSVAIDAGGVVLANVEGADPDNTDVDRYAADGTALAPVGPFAGYHGMITTDSSGALVHTQSGHSDVHLGAPNATASFETVSAAYVSAGAAAAGADVGWVYWQDTDDISEWRARRYNAAGVQTWFMSRPALACDVGIACNAMPYSISGAATGRIAVGGHYDGLGPKTAWVQVYDP